MSQFQALMMKKGLLGDEKDKTRKEKEGEDGE